MHQLVSYMWHYFLCFFAQILQERGSRIWAQSGACCHKYKKKKHAKTHISFPVNISAHQKRHATNTSQNMPRTRAPFLHLKKIPGTRKTYQRADSMSPPHGGWSEAKRSGWNPICCRPAFSFCFLFFLACSVDCKHLSVNTRKRVEGWGEVVSSLCLFNWIFFFPFFEWVGWGGGLAD